MKKQILIFLVIVMTWAITPAFGLDEETKDLKTAPPPLKKDVGRGLLTKIQAVCRVFQSPVHQDDNAWNRFGDSYWLWASPTEGMMGIIPFIPESSKSEEKN